MKSLTKKLLAAYIIWGMLQLVFLVIGDHFFGEIEINHYLGYVEDDFFPFNEFYLKDYDITEFIIYMVFPVAIFWVVKLFREDTK